MKRLALFLAIVAFASATSPSAFAVENGTDVTGNAVAVQVVANTSPTSSIKCSGALIAPSIVATAGHCVLDVNGLVSKQIWVGNPGTSLDLNALTSSLMVSSVQITSSFKNGASLTVGNDDVVFLILTTPRNLTVPIRLPSEADTQSFKSSKIPLKLIGFGYTSNSATGSSPTPYAMDATFGSEQYSQVDSANANSTLGGICSGDSGGPVLVSTASELILVGVITGAQLGGAHCATKAASGVYQTQFTLLSRYSNLAFAAASVQMNAEDVLIATLNQQNQSLTNSSKQQLQNLDFLNSTNLDLQNKLEVSNSSSQTALKQIDNLNSQIGELSKKVPSTITCVKGHISKSVTGVKPSCPSGYKKK